MRNDLRNVLVSLRETNVITRSVMSTLAMLAILVAGCGRSLPETAPVEGHVTIDGKPLTTGIIMFIPAQGRPATASIGSDGVYRLTTFETEDGALPGTHVVTIAADEVINAVAAPAVPQSYEEEMQGGQQGDKQPPQPVRKLRYIVPAKYANQATSGLTANVQAQSEPNRIDFDLRK